MTAGSAADPVADVARDLADRIAGTGVTSVVGVGIDSVDLDRFRAVMTRRPGLARRLFTDGELAYAAQVPDPLPRLATRFATKEAVMKALGVGLWSFRLTDVEVERAGLDAPDGGAARCGGRPGRNCRRDPLAPVAHPHRHGGHGRGGGRRGRGTLTCNRS